MADMGAKVALFTVESRRDNIFNIYLILTLAILRSLRYGDVNSFDGTHAVIFLARGALNSSASYTTAAKNKRTRQWNVLWLIMSASASTAHAATTTRGICLNYMCTYVYVFVAVFCKV